MHTLKSVMNGSCLSEKYIPDFSELSRIVKQFKDGGFTVVLTQGVYDMFHVGHGRYLAEARSYGDVLIVGVDSDELTKDMKGPSRPFDVFDERIEVLSMLSSVSVLTRRHTDQHKYDLIKLVRPHVLVMSKTTSSFTDEDKIALDEHCERIEHLEAKAATTTTAKMLRLMTEGAQGLAEEINTTVANYFRKNGVS